MREVQVTLETVTPLFLGEKELIYPNHFSEG